MPGARLPVPGDIIPAMLTLCCQCKEMQKVRGVWRPLTELVEWYAREFPDRVSHGYCDQCRDAFLEKCAEAEMRFHEGA